MSGEVTVDGVLYRWVIKYQEDPDAGSLSFSKRGIDNSFCFVEIHSDGRPSITFDFPERSSWRFARRPAFQSLDTASVDAAIKTLPAG